MTRLLIALLLSIPLLAQDATPPPAKKTEAKPATAHPDTKSPDALLKAVYESISGPAAQKRDWKRLRRLFHPTARMVAIVKRAGKNSSIVMSVEDYITRVGPQLEKRGFFEKEVGRKVQRFGPILHAWSRYEGRFTPDAKSPPDLEGFNSFQLMQSEGRWWILNLMWTPATADLPMPKK